MLFREKRPEVSPGIKCSLLALLFLRAFEQEAPGKTSIFPCASLQRCQHVHAALLHTVHGWMEGICGRSLADDESAASSKLGKFSRLLARVGKEQMWPSWRVSFLGRVCPKHPGKKGFSSFPPNLKLDEGSWGRKKEWKVTRVADELMVHYLLKESRARAAAGTTS